LWARDHRKGNEFKALTEELRKAIADRASELRNREVRRPTVTPTAAKYPQLVPADNSTSFGEAYPMRCGEALLGRLSAHLRNKLEQVVDSSEEAAMARVRMIVRGYEGSLL